MVSKASSVIRTAVVCVNKADSVGKGSSIQMRVCVCVWGSTKNNYTNLMNYSQIYQPSLLLTDKSISMSNSTVNHAIRD